MQIDNNHLGSILTNYDLTKCSSGLIGIEKENLRVLNFEISKRQHDKSLGSSLCNKYITTDFSESQLEFITPPMDNPIDCLNFLENMHQFVQKRIGKEILWPFSMPPFIEREDDIQIARYGNSNLGLFKMMYRRGLSHRYGKLMQTISGVHYNFSFPEIFFKDINDEFPDFDQKEIRASIYLRSIRNLYRINWLLLYLFGASPIVSKSFEKNVSDEFITYNDSYYLPFATSLRMSDLGYNISHRSDLFISLNNLDEYINGLYGATRIESEIFSDIPDYQAGLRTQISSNILQIEDEYYAVSRPKSSLLENIRLTEKLKISGIDYIELRSIDLDPFLKAGISLEAMEFLKVVLIYCTVSSSPEMDLREYKEIRNNDLKVSRMGRKRGLFISKDSVNISLEDWAKEIFDELYLINEAIGNDQKIIDEYNARLRFKEETPSAQLLDKFLSSKKTLEELGTEIAEINREDFLRVESSVNTNHKIFEREALQSIKEKENLESSNELSFDEYLDNYFKS